MERGRFDKDSTVWRTIADATGQLQGQRAKENVVQILSTRGHRLSRTLAEEFLIARFRLRFRHRLETSEEQEANDSEKEILKNLLSIFYKNFLFPL